MTACTGEVGAGGASLLLTRTGTQANMGIKFKFGRSGMLLTEATCSCVAVYKSKGFSRGTCGRRCAVYGSGGVCRFCCSTVQDSGTR